MWKPQMTGIFGCVVCCCDYPCPPVAVYCCCVELDCWVELAADCDCYALGCCCVFVVVAEGDCEEAACCEVTVVELGGCETLDCAWWLLSTAFWFGGIWPAPPVGYTTTIWLDCCCYMTTLAEVTFMPLLPVALPGWLSGLPGEVS